jgi:putative hydrolase of the HAD superfamily
LTRNERLSGIDVFAIRGVLFDAVGTLIEPWPPAAEVYAAAALRQRVSLPIDVVRERFHRAFREEEARDDAHDFITSEPRERRRWRTIVAACLRELSDPERAFHELWHHFSRADSWRTHPTAPAALHTLAHAGYHLAIASNFDSRLRTVLAGLPDLARWAATALISSELGVRKPHPGFYRIACRRIDLLPSQVLFIGDNPEHDLDGPRRAGLQSALVSSGKSSDSGASIADLSRRLLDSREQRGASESPGLSP